ncbi:DUF1385 domain-containing protein [Parvibacter caecicola]|uniref:Uncharacterized protein YqhQ n=1 Tax=Parvibacter caecicola TaxID=747645 RepID=A0A7W5D1P3_9ACTN|nr:DUF1385 domain-containing protein [Parvibacter caecicola]MBB3170856.1 uncharacterized protein YqhQ [Parvibacter caecicola]MCR2042403.1 DUF1385 domain-containing protein [Parvibacter caecicola]
MSEQQPKKSDLSRAFSEDGAKKTHIGGQALIEGIMMRGKLNWAVAVRTPDGGIYLEEHDLASGKQKNGWMYWPLVRGCRALVESLVLGFKALEIAAMHAFGDEEGEEEALAQAQAVEVQEELAAAGAVALSEEKHFVWKRDFGNPDTMVDGLGAQRTLEVVQGPEGDAPEGAEEAAEAASAEATPGEAAPDEGGAPCEVREVSADEPEMEFGHKEMVFSMVFGVVLGVVLFIVAPAVITNLLVGEYDGNLVLWNVVDGILRVAVFVFYLWLIGRMEDVRRMFMYHGAEHKTIHCHEHGLPLTVENARSFPRLHVRCGTAFLIMVMIIAILVYTIFPLNSLIGAWGVPEGLPKLALVILVRILLMPVIAGISYEITVRWAGSHPDNPLVKVVLWPGMQMQYLTTNEPDDRQLECAIAAMERVLARECSAA